MLKIGDFAKVHGLKNSTHLNGRHVEIMTDLFSVDVPEEDGVRREALRHGVRFITDLKKTGYMKPENLEPLADSGTGMHRAIWIHETGMEPPETGDA